MDETTRRKFLTGGLSVGGLLAYMAAGTENVSASHVSTQGVTPLLELGNPPVGQVFEVNDQLILEHRSGAQFAFNPVENQWELDQGLDLLGNDLTGVNNLVSQAIATDQATINQLVAAVHGTTNMSVSTGTNTKVDLDVVDQEDSDVVTVDLANNEIDVDVAGDYIAHMVTSWSSDSNWSTGDLAQLRINVNGSLDIAKTTRKISTVSQSVELWAYLEALSVNDTISFLVQQDSGSTITLTQSANITEFTLHRVG